MNLAEYASCDALGVAEPPTDDRLTAEQKVIVERLLAGDGQTAPLDTTGRRGRLQLRDELLTKQGGLRQKSLHSQSTGLASAASST